VGSGSIFSRKKTFFFKTPEAAVIGFVLRGALVKSTP
jgi:hypothetical protein